MIRPQSSTHLHAFHISLHSLLSQFMHLSKTDYETLFSPTYTHTDWLHLFTLQATQILTLHLSIYLTIFLFIATLPTTISFPIYLWSIFQHAFSLSTFLSHSVLSLCLPDFVPRSFLPGHRFSNYSSAPVYISPRCLFLPSSHLPSPSTTIILLHPLPIHQHHPPPLPPSHHFTFPLPICRIHTTDPKSDKWLQT